jgi:hypothetical protein
MDRGHAERVERAKEKLPEGQGEGSDPCRESLGKRGAVQITSIDSVDTPGCGCLLATQRVVVVVRIEDEGEKRDEGSSRSSTYPCSLKLAARGKVRVRGAVSGQSDAR